MTPILGIMASQISGHLYAPTGSMYHIASTTLSTATASVTFSSIPADYTHLQIRILSRTTDPVAYDDYVETNLNGDTGANYSRHQLEGNGSTASAFGSGNTTFMGNGPTATDGNSASIFGVTIIDILDYANTNKYKTVRSLGGYDANGSGGLMLSSGNWRNTNAVTSIVLTTHNALNYLTYSSFSLYGVK